MRLDVQVKGKHVAKLYRERDEYIMHYVAGINPADFVSLTMPVREQPWRWPRDLHPFFRQNLPEGYLLSIIREEFAPLLDGTDLSLLAVVGGMGIGRVTLTPEDASPGTPLALTCPQSHRERSWIASDGSCSQITSCGMLTVTQRTWRSITHRWPMWRTHPPTIS